MMTLDKFAMGTLPPTVGSITRTTLDEHAIGTLAPTVGLITMF